MYFQLLYKEPLLSAKKMPSYYDNLYPLSQAAIL